MSFLYERSAILKAQGLWQLLPVIGRFMSTFRWWLAVFFLSHPAPPPTPRLFLYNSPSVDFVNTVKCILISSTCFWYTQTNSWSYWFGTTVHLFRDGCVQQRLMMSDRSDRLIICYFTFSDRAGVGEECMWRHRSMLTPLASLPTGVLFVLTDSKFTN